MNDEEISAEAYDLRKEKIVQLLNAVQQYAEHFDSEGDYYREIARQSEENMLDMFQEIFNIQRPVLKYGEGHGLFGGVWDLSLDE